MLNFKRPLLLFLLSCGLCLNVNMQTTTTSEDQQRRQEEIFQQRQEADLRRRMATMDRLFRNGDAEIYPRNRFPRTVSLSGKEKAKIKAIIAPSAEDAARYKDFLKGKNTGLFRLFPDYDCESKNVIRADGNCADTVPGSWNYSFRSKNYSNADFLDIQFKDGNIISQGFLTQGILTRLGDVSLESVSAATAGIQQLLAFVPSDQMDEAKKQFVRISTGFAVGNYKYANNIKIEENTTYVLRSIAYRSKVNNRRLSEFTTAQDFKLINLNYADKRVDMTVAFRIIRRDENGSITILWKELARRNAPKIVFAKGDKLLDFKSDK